MPTNSLPTRWPMVTLLVVTGVIAAAQMYKLAPALPSLRADLGITLISGGWLISLNNLLGALFGMIAGLAADRIGHRRILMAGLGVLTLASITGGLTENVTILFVTRFFEGFGFLATVVSVPSLILRETAARDRPMALAFWSVYNPAGGALLFLSIPLILAAGSWRGLWFDLAIVCALILGLIVLFKPRPKPAGSKPLPIAAGIAHTLGRLGPWCAGLSFTLYSLQFIIIMSWLPTVMIEEYGLPRSTSSQLTALALASNIIGNISAGRLLNRGWKHGHIVIITAICMAVAAAIIFSSLPNTARYLACVALSLFGGLLPGAIMAVAPLIAPSPQEIGAVNGMIVQGSNIGILSGPPLAAWFASHFGDWNALLGIFLAANCGLVVIGWLLTRAPAAAKN